MKQKRCTEEQNALSRLGLDWDETAAEYPKAFGMLCERFDEVYIITLNHGVTIEEAEGLLGCIVTGIRYCPDAMVIDGLSHVWKGDTCEALGIDLFFDDDLDVIEECTRRGIMAIGVSPRPVSRS